MNEVKISTNTILTLILSIGVMIALILGINSYDASRKSIQVEEIYNSIDKSPYVAKLINHISELDTSNYELLNNIVETIDLLELETANIGSCKLYIKKEGVYLEFPYYSYNQKNVYFKIKKNLTIKDEDLLNHIIQDQKNTISILQGFNKDLDKIKTFNILVNNESMLAFLISTKFRN